MPPARDHLATQETYLENELRRQMRAPIKEISLKKVPGTNGYKVQPTITSGNEEKILSLDLPFAASALLLCNKSDLNALAKAIMIDLKQIIVS